MRLNLKLLIVVFLSVLVPITLWNAVNLYFAQSCDPKFGCLGVFKLLTLIICVYALISAFSLLIVRRFLIRNKQSNFCNQELICLTLTGTILSVLCSQPIAIAESFGILNTVLLWSVISFIIGYIALNLNKKYNKQLHRTP
jgi:uncharacterized membrane protein